VHRVKKELLQKDFCEGGLKMINLNLFILALKTTWVRKLINKTNTFSEPVFIEYWFVFYFYSFVHPQWRRQKIFPCKVFFFINKGVPSIWSKRNLTVIGKITVVKTLILPVLNHLIITLPNPTQDILKKVNELIFTSKLIPNSLKDVLPQDKFLC
jgi:hypothetical protein